MRTAFVNGSVFVGDGRILQNATVVIEDDAIAEVAQGGLELGDEVKQIALEGRFLLPGLIDVHTHITSDGSVADPITKIINQSIPEITLESAANAKRTVTAGITSIRDLGGPDGIDLALRDAIEAGTLTGPRMKASARVVCMTGGHGWYFIGREADGPDEVRKAAREQIRAGADVVKLMATGGVMTKGVDPGAAQLTEEEMRGAIEEAHKAGRTTATHAQGAQGVKNALLAGIDTIEHGIFLDEELVQLMIDRGVFFVPTVSALHHILRGGREAGVPEYAMEKTERVKEFHDASIKLALEAGVKIAMGTDAGTPFNEHGANAWELELLVDRGMAPIDAIKAGTSVASEVMGWQDRLGTIEKGKLADLIVVDGDPVADIGLLRQAEAIALVMQGGRIIKG